MSTMVSLITGVSIVYSTFCSGVDQRKHQRSALLAFVRGIHRWPVNSPHKGPVTPKMVPFDDVIMYHDNSLLTMWQSCHNWAVRGKGVVSQTLVWSTGAVPIISFDRESRLRIIFIYLVCSISLYQEGLKKRMKTMSTYPPSPQF